MNHIPTFFFLLFSLFPLLCAQEVDVFLAAGQSNATSTWATGIEEKLNELRPSKASVVVQVNHPGNWMGSWWNDGAAVPGAQQNYVDMRDALLAELTSLENEGKTPVYRGLFWFQGEGDAFSESSMSKYAARFKRIVQQVETDSGDSGSTAVLVAIDANPDPQYDDDGVAPHEAPMYGVTREKIESMRGIHFALGTDPSLRGFCVDSRGYVRGDAWHLTPAEARALGQEIGQRYVDQFWSGGAAPSNPVDVYLSMGQSNPGSTWSDAIESRLNELRPGQQSVVVYTNHSASGMGSWWNDGAGANYNSDLAALQAEMANLTAAGKSPVFRGIFWWQGETTDAYSMNSMGKYKARFKSMVAQFKSDLAVSELTTVIVAVDRDLDPQYENLDGIPTSNLAYLRGLQAELGSDPDLNGFSADSRPYERTGGWHMVTEDRVRFGHAIAQSYVDHYGSGVGLDYAGWHLRSFAASSIPESLQTVTADPDADGIINLLEYALGLDPTTPEAEPPLHLEADASGVIRYRYRRQRGGSTATDLSYSYSGITYHVEAVKRLTGSSWSGGAEVYAVESVQDVGAGMEEVELRVLNPFLDENSCFLRLRVSQDP